MPSKPLFQEPKKFIVLTMENFRLDADYQDFLKVNFGDEEAAFAQWRGLVRHENKTFLHNEDAAKRSAEMARRNAMEAERLAKDEAARKAAAGKNTKPQAYFTGAGPSHK